MQVLVTGGAGYVGSVVAEELPINTSRRRPGDPAVLVASSERARAELGWQPEFPEPEAIIESAWRWLREHPKGYNE